MGYKHWLGLAATCISFCAYIPYLVSLFRGRIKPHIFSWLVWGLGSLIAFAIQLSKQAFASASVAGCSTFIALFIVLYSFRRAEKNIALRDWGTFAAALLALIVWAATQEPLWSVIILVIIDALGFYPTFRKSWGKPYEELAFAYILHGIKWVLAILALDKLSLTTWLYPASLIVTNLSFAMMLCFRRRFIFAQTEG